ncbi:hypothetical protein PR003_g935 [Phytophthora rubi]|uniref:Uncharacterized protein n=1 Tax=Phytophthora rubi TaxID=129364 RepID=A0A6A4G988_9STRA|nr:hypothetical protein PR003_g935 [Phytophthora rubi]
MHELNEVEGGREADNEEDEDDGEVGVEEEESVPNVHLSFDDYRDIVSWVKVEKNFEAIHGTGDKSKIGGGAKIKTIDVFKALAKHLKQHSTNLALRRLKLTGRNMQQRWQRFKKTLRANHTQTGLDPTKQELAQGMSIADMLENMCPHYSRVIFGLKADVTPFATVELGVPASPAYSSASASMYEMRMLHWKAPATATTFGATRS